MLRAVLTLMILFNSVALAEVHAAGGTMPAELVGEWGSQAPGQQCVGTFTVRRDGYSGQQESEGYGCVLNTVKGVTSGDRTWNAALSCSGEDPRKVAMTATLNLREFEGRDLLVVVERWPKGAPAIVVLRRCTQR